MKRICVIGANGFIGKFLYKALESSDNLAQGFVRTTDLNKNHDEIKYIQLGDIRSKVNLKDQFHNCDCIIHCAGISHSMNKRNKFDIFCSVNVEGTKNLAEQAVIAGVKRFIFLSSVKVYGESTGETDDLKIFTNNDTPNPQDHYSISKFEAEKILWEISSKTDLEVVVVRLPLVYGFGAKGNLERLMKLIDFKIPLPFKGIKNKRSLIGIDNVVDILIRCIKHPDAAGKTFLVSDGEDLSTPELIRFIALAMDQPVKLFSLPKILLKFFGFIIGKQKEMKKLIGSLQIDNSYTRKILNWTPPVSVQEGIRRMIKGK